jgi:hypothetical protein
MNGLRSGRSAVNKKHQEIKIRKIKAYGLRGRSGRSLIYGKEKLCTK